MPQRLTAHKIPSRAMTHGGTRKLLIGACALALVAFGGTAGAQNFLNDERLVPEQQIESTYGKYLSGRYAQFIGDLDGAAGFYERALAEADRSEEPCWEPWWRRGFGRRMSLEKFCGGSSVPVI